MQGGSGGEIWESKYFSYQQKRRGEVFTHFTVRFSVPRLLSLPPRRPSVVSSAHPEHPPPCARASGAEGVVAAAVLQGEEDEDGGEEEEEDHEEEDEARVRSLKVLHVGHAGILQGVPVCVR